MLMKKEIIDDNKRLREENNILNKEIERLKKREQECIDHYLVQCKYASEMESKYISANYVINELEKWVKEDDKCFETQFYMGRCVNFQCILDKLQELKGESNEED